MAELDATDEHILYRLSEDARNTSAPEIADELDVSASTVRNRIDRLEERGVIAGYHAHIDYEACENRLVGVFECTSSVAEQEHLAARALRIPGVVNVREVLSGHGNIHAKVVAEDTDGFTRIARKLTNLGLEIETEEFLQNESFHPYHAFGPNTEEPAAPTGMETTPNDTILTVAEDAEVAGMTLKEANRAGLVGENVVVVAVERDGSVIAPRGDTMLEVGDRVKLFSPDDITERDRAVFA